MPQSLSRVLAMITFLVFHFAHIITGNNQANGKSYFATGSVLKYQLSNDNDEAQGEERENVTL